MLLLCQVWSPPSYPASEDESPRPLFSFDGLHQRGVCCLAFSSSLTSSSGKDAEADADPHLLVSVGLDDDHTVGVYSVDPSEKNKKKGLLVCSAKGSKQRVGQDHEHHGQTHTAGSGTPHACRAD